MREIRQKLLKFKDEYYARSARDGNTLEAEESPLKTDPSGRVKSKDLLHWALGKGFELKYNEKYHLRCSREALRSNHN